MHSHIWLQVYILSALSFNALMTCIKDSWGWLYNAVYMLYLNILLSLVVTQETYNKTSLVTTKNFTNYHLGLDGPLNNCRNKDSKTRS